MASTKTAIKSFISFTSSLFLPLSSSFDSLSQLTNYFYCYICRTRPSKKIHFVAGLRFWNPEIARAPVLFSKKNLMVVSKQLVSFYCFVTQNIYCLVVKLLWLSLLYFKLAFYLFCFIFRLLFPVPFRVLFFHTHSVTNESVVDGFTTRSEKLL